MRKRYYQKILVENSKTSIKNFQWYKKQHEKEIAAWRLGCSTILMLLEILWVFDKYLPQPCFPEWHENKEIIQRDVKNICPSIKIISLFSLLSLPLEILWVFDKYLSQPCFLKKEINKNRKSYRAVKCIFFPKPKIRYFQIEHSHFICLLATFMAKPGFFCNKSHSSLQFF